MALVIKNLNLYYGDKQAIFELNTHFPNKEVTAVIGPSGCGKSTMLRSINRMNDLVEGFHAEGEILFKEKNILKIKDPSPLRREIGMVFQKPNPFPKSIYKNITWGPKVNGMKLDYDELVEQCLRKAALWDEVKDRLHESALSLSGGQQQRLCIARTIAMKPKIILMDEPCSALDPRSTARIEELILELSSDYTIIIVTHNMQQAARVSKNTLFFLNGELVEQGPTAKIFTNPNQKATQDYITGKFG